MTRRDRCYLIGKRAQKLTAAQAAAAWYHFSQKIEAMGSEDIPKFNDLLMAFRTTTILAKKCEGIPCQTSKMH